jgi:phytoene/squalene synthetase
MMLVLNDFEKIVTQSVVSGYSTNPVVHAFALTAKKYDITESLTTPFFESMRVDVAKTTYDQADYEQYIYGSAEVIGLMCLKVFCEGDDGAYKQLKEGARALGAAYQKINFLRDVAADYKELGRLYFPGSVRYESFSEADKQSIIDDCKADLEKAGQSVMQLPKNAQDAVRLSWRYYTALLQKLENTPAEVLKRERVRISDGKKLRMLIPFLPRLVAQR